LVRLLLLVNRELVGNEQLKCSSARCGNGREDESPMMASRTISRINLRHAIALILWLLMGPSYLEAATFSVTTTNDSGTGSFRQAILDANSDGLSEVIVFNIAGAGPYLITPVTPLPVLSTPVTIDAATQPGYAGAPLVELNGTLLSGNPAGIQLNGGNSTVRGLAINRFGGPGILLTTEGNVIEGNFIGTDLSGTLALGNGVGIQINGNNNRIGGTNLVSGNLISGNLGAGVDCQSNTNLFQGNMIGTDLSGNLNLSNGLAGISINGNANLVGGQGSRAGNAIAFNGAAGVAISSGQNNTVVANSSYSNAGLAIDLNEDGVSANDPNDTDGGANNRQNFPVLTGATASGGNVTIQGNFNSTPNLSFQIDFYASPTIHPSGFGEGKFYLGSATLNTDLNGNAVVTKTVPASTVPAGAYITATATDPAGNTSEFSNGQQFAPIAPVNVSVVVNAATNVVQYGNQVAYSITVTNSGISTATGVIVTNLLPAGTQYIYADSTQGTFSRMSNIITFSLGTLPPGMSARMNVYVSPQSTGVFTNTASVTINEYNLATSVSSQFAVNVFVVPAPIITTQPSSQLLNLGGLLHLVVNAIASPNVRYQWRLNGDNIPGAIGPTYTVLALLAKDAGSYTVVVYDEFGATISEPALITLNGLLRFPASDNFASRGAMLNLLNLISYDNIDATSEPGEPLHAGVPGGKSVWFTWTPLLGGVVTFSTAGSSFDTLLAVYTGNNLTNLTEVASDDDSDGFYTSKVTFNAVAGTKYSIAVDGAYGASGEIVLNSSLQLLATTPHIVNRLTNQIVGFGGTARFAAQATGSGLAYQWFFNDTPIPGATGSSLQITNVSMAKVGLYRLQATSGSRSVISEPASLQICMLDGVANTDLGARDKFQATATAVAALFGLDSVTKSSGKSYTKFGGGVSRGYTGTQVFNTYGDGTQQGEPNNCNKPGGSSAWTSVQAPDDGLMEMDTDGSNFKTILGVYTGNGNDFSTLVPVACDIGSGTGGTNSMVTFAVTSNTVYFVAVDGIDGSYGTVAYESNRFSGGIRYLICRGHWISDASLPMVARRMVDAWRNQLVFDNHKFSGGKGRQLRDDCK
jgi:uncharacterized repeat protein (TIGR01451 family)